jgi:hypothetical protein
MDGVRPASGCFAVLVWLALLVGYAVLMHDVNKDREPCIADECLEIEGWYGW